MPLINIIIILVVIGAGLWAINKYIPMAPPIKTILNVVVVIVVCLWLLRIFGIIGSVHGITVN
jgi:hypothetical protein